MRTTTDINTSPEYVKTGTVLTYLDVSVNKLAAIRKEYNLQPVRLLGENYYNLKEIKNLFDVLSTNNKMKN